MCVRNEGLGWNMEMKRKIVLFLVLLLSSLSVIFIASVIMGCESRYDPDLFGMHETLAYRSLPPENLSISRAFEIMHSLGVKKLRMNIWRCKFMLNSTEIDPSLRNAIKEVIGNASSLGIEIMGYAEDFPSWMTNITGDPRAIPRRNMTEYTVFLERYEKSWETLARAFPNITMWEIGNEYNLREFLHPQNGTFLRQERVDIVTDLLYYGSRGIKAGNPTATTVMCGLGPIKNSTYGNGIYDIRDFLDFIYENIKSDRWNSTNPDDFFQVACWHPYTFGKKPTKENWVNPNKAVYEVMRRHNDTDKRVIFSEMGYSDNVASSHYAPRDKIGEYITEAFRLARNHFCWLDTIYWFRLTDRDDGFGVVESPENWTWKPATYAYESLTHPFPWWILGMVSGGCLLVTAAVLIFHRLRFRSKVLTDAPKTN